MPPSTKWSSSGPRVSRELRLLHVFAATAVEGLGLSKLWSVVVSGGQVKPKEFLEQVSGHSLALLAGKFPAKISQFAKDFYHFLRTISPAV